MRSAAASRVDALLFATLEPAVCREAQRRDDPGRARPAGVDRARSSWAARRAWAWRRCCSVSTWRRRAVVRSCAPPTSSSARPAAAARARAATPRSPSSPAPTPRPSRSWSAAPRRRSRSSTPGACPRSASPRQWEERFTADTMAPVVADTAKRALESAGVAPGALSTVILDGTNRAQPGGVAEGARPARRSSSPIRWPAASGAPARPMRAFCSRARSIGPSPETASWWSAWPTASTRWCSR